MSDFLKGKLKQIFWIGVVVALSLLLTFLAILFKDEAEKTEPPSIVKRVSTQKAYRVDEPVTVVAHGIVQPDQEIHLKSEVNGRVVAKNSRLAAGGIVKKGDLLVQIDPRDFVNAVQQEIAALEKAKLELEVEKGRQLIAYREWEKLSSSIDVNDLSEQLALRKPHLKEKEAQVEAAKSRLYKSEIDLGRTEVTAPIDAIVIAANLEEGSYLSPQEQFAKLAGTERFRVQVSIPVAKLKWLMIPGQESPVGSPVNVIQDLGGVAIARKGHILRLLGDLDPNGRMARVLVGVEDPLGLKNPSSFPLLIGSYVRVEFQGPLLQSIFALPREFVHEEDKIWIKNQNNQLEVRKVNVLQKGEDIIYVDGGLEEGDAIVISPIAIPIPGMLLQEENHHQIEE